MIAKTLNGRSLFTKIQIYASVPVAAGSRGLLVLLKIVLSVDRKTMTTLKDYLTDSLSYDNSWGIWAEFEGKFELNSDARLGQLCFENGGVLDDYKFVGNNIAIIDARDEYCGTDEGCENFYEEWAEQFVENMNNAIR